MRYAANTHVSSEQSRAEIERTIKRYGATAFAYGSIDTASMIEFQVNGKRIRFVVPMPDPQDDKFGRTGCRAPYSHSKDPNGYHSGGCFSARSPEATHKDWEQACRQRWRALALVIKAKLEYVATGIKTIESEFMAEIVLPNGKTAGEHFLPRIDEAYQTGKVPALSWDGR